MRLNKITFKNFMPYRREQSVVFSSGSRNVVVVYGDNMRGKTSFLNAIRFAFFGYATARHLRNIDRINLINDEAKAIGDWTLSVSVEVETASAVYELRRELRPLQHVAHPTSDADLHETFSMRKDGVPVTGKDRAFEMNQLMPEGISRFFLFDGELLQEYEILVRDTESAPKIKQAIEHVLGVPALTKGGDEIRTLLNQAQERQADDLKQLRSLTSQAEQQRTLQKQIHTLREAQARQRAEYDKLEARASDLQQRLESMSRAVDLARQLHEMESELKLINGQITSARVRRADLLQDAWRDLIEPQTVLVRRGLEEERDEHLAKVRSNAVTLSQIDTVRKSLAASECVTCDQTLKPSATARLVDRLKDLEHALAHSQTGLDRVSQLSNQIEQLAKIRGLGLADRVIEAERQLRGLLVSRTSTQNKIAEVRQALREFETDAVERVRAEREQVLTLAASIEREMGTRAADIAGRTRKLDQISRMLSRNPEARGHRSSRLVAAYGALDRIFTAGVDILRDRQRQRVEDYASSAFSQLTSEQDFKRLSINENYGLTIIDEKGREVPERSAGAEQIVAISLIDGLNKAGRRGGPIVMDTPFGRLDWVHRKNVLSFLPEMAEQVVLLVHEGEMERERDLPLLKHRISKVYRINRISSRESEIVLEHEEFDS